MLKIDVRKLNKTVDLPEGPNIELCGGEELGEEPPPKLSIVPREGCVGVNFVITIQVKFI